MHPPFAQTMKPGLWETNNKTSDVVAASGKWLKADCGSVKPVTAAK